MKALFISREDLIKNTPISGDMDFDKLIQFVNIAQDVHIQGILGSKLYDRLQSDIIAGTLSGNYLTLVNEYIKPMTIQYSFLEFLPFSSYTISNKGVFKHTSENSTNIDTHELSDMKGSCRATALHYTKRVTDYMNFNNTLFPEYLTGNNDDMRPDRDNTFYGWNI